MSFDPSLGGAFLAGVLSFLSPCVLPLVPAYLCFLSGMSFAQLSGGEQASRAVLVSRAFAFVLGFATIFVILGATASALGQGLARWFDHLAVVAGVILVVLGIHMTGLVRIPFLMREARARSESRPAGLAGAYVVGLAFGFGWTPCVGPVLAGILMLSATSDSLTRGTALLAAYAAGIGTPFIIAALFAGPFLRWLGSIRRHVATVERVTGGILILTGMLVMTGQMARVGGWLLDTFPALGRIG